MIKSLYRNFQLLDRYYLLCNIVYMSTFALSNKTTDNRIENLN